MNSTIIFDKDTTSKIIAVATPSKGLQLNERFKDSTGARYEVTFVSQPVCNNKGDQIAFALARRI